MTTQTRSIFLPVATVGLPQMTMRHEVSTTDGVNFTVCVERTITKPCGDEVESYISELRDYCKGLKPAFITLDEAIGEHDNSELRISGYRPATESELEIIRPFFA